MKRAVTAALVGITLTAAAAVQAETKYVEPQDLTAADRAAISSSVQSYGACLQREAGALLTKYKDSRHIADVAMQKCQASLAKVNKLMNDRHVDPGFVKGFVRMSRNREANKMLQEVMMYKASHAAQQQQSQ